MNSAPQALSCKRSPNWPQSAGVHRTDFWSVPRGIVLSPAAQMQQQAAQMAGSRQPQEVDFETWNSGFGGDSADKVEHKCSLFQGFG